MNLIYTEQLIDNTWVCIDAIMDGRLALWGYEMKTKDNPNAEYRLLDEDGEIINIDELREWTESIRVAQ